MRLMFWTGFWVFTVDQVIKFYVLFSVFGLSWAQVRVPSDQLPYPPSVEVRSWGGIDYPREKDRYVMDNDVVLPSEVSGY